MEVDNINLMDWGFSLYQFSHRHVIYLSCPLLLVTMSFATYCGSRVLQMIDGRTFNKGRLITFHFTYPDCFSGIVLIQFTNGYIKEKFIVTGNLLFDFIDSKCRLYNSLN